MDLQTPSTAIFVRDIELAKKFYNGILGLGIKLDFGKNVIFSNGFAIWEIRPDHIISKSLGYENLSDTAVNRFEIYFETENLQEVAQTLKVSGVRFLHDLNEEPWGQMTIRFFDPDNHLIEVGETMGQFITRYHMKGMTVAEISRKTSVPEDEISLLLMKQGRILNTDTAGFVI